MRQVKADDNDRIRLALFQFNWLLRFSSTVKKMQQADIIVFSFLREIFIYFIVDIITHFFGICKCVNRIITFYYSLYTLNRFLLY